MSGLVQLCGDLFGPASDLAVRSAAVLGVVSVFVLLLRRTSSAVRHLVWSLAFIGVLLLPAVSAIIPARIALPIELPSVEMSQTLESPVEYAMTEVTTDESAWMLDEREFSGFLDTSTSLSDIRAGLGEESPLVASAAPVAAPSIEIPWRALSVAVWLIGAILLVSPLVLGGWSLYRLRRSSQPLPAEIAEELRELSGRVLGRRAVVGLQTASRQMPMTWGVLRPVVLLPAAAADWSAERRRVVLLHELSHIRRHDCLLQMIGQLARALHWFNPLAWWALSQLRLEQEKACDDAVLILGTHADEYAAELLAVSARLPELSWDSAVALAMSRVTRLEQRLKAILNMNNNRHPVSKWSALCSLAVLTSVVLGTASLYRPVQAAPPPAGPATAAVGLVEPVEQPKAASPILEANVKEPVASTTAVAQAAAPQAEKPAEKKEPAAAPPVAPAATPLGLSGVVERIESSALQAVDRKALNEAAIRGMLQSLKDPYSTFITAEELQTFHQQIEGKLVGIGAALKLDEKRIVIVQVIPNSPALKSGLKADDEILEINGKTFSDLQETVKAIRGQAGTEVTLKIRRDKTDSTLTLQRAEVRLSAVKGMSTDQQGQPDFWLNQNQKLGYIRLESIDAPVVADMNAALKKLSDGGVKGLVLDLRGNPGGLLNSVVEVAQLFLKDSVVVRTQSRKNEGDNEIKTMAAVAYPDLPLIVLVNRYTASAAEVLSAALQDNGRALIIGERTFGKGTIQSIIPVGVNEKGPAVRLTTAQMLTPKGRAWHRQPDSKQWGIDPQDGFYVSSAIDQLKESVRKGQIFRDIESGKVKRPQEWTPELVEQLLVDPALAAAFKALQDKLATGEYKPTGRPLADQQAFLDKQQELRKQRDEVLQKLEQLDRELGNVR